MIFNFSLGKITIFFNTVEKVDESFAARFVLGDPGNVMVVVPLIEACSEKQDKIQALREHIH